jgi:hypothetical protein
MKVKITLSLAERTMIVAALMAYGVPELASKLAGPLSDPADDGPEAAILSVEKEAQS